MVFGMELLNKLKEAFLRRLAPATLPTDVQDLQEYREATNRYSPCLHGGAHARLVSASYRCRIAASAFLIWASDCVLKTSFFSSQPRRATSMPKLV